MDVPGVIAWLTSAVNGISDSLGKACFISDWAVVVNQSMFEALGITEATDKADSQRLSNAIAEQSKPDWPAWPECIWMLDLGTCDAHLRVQEDYGSMQFHTLIEFTDDGAAIHAPGRPTTDEKCVFAVSHENAIAYIVIHLALQISKVAEHQANSARRSALIDIMTVKV